MTGGRSCLPPFRQIRAGMALEVSSNRQPISPLMLAAPSIQRPPTVMKERGIEDTEEESRKWLEEVIADVREVDRRRRFNGADCGLEQERFAKASAPIPPFHPIMTTAIVRIPVTYGRLTAAK